MGDKCNCYRFSPRDSLSGAVAQMADYLSKHPGWNESELRALVDGLISASGVESFNGRTGTVILDKNDVNNLKIASAYFAEGDESIDSLDLVSLYNQGVRFVFTDFNSVTSGYNLAFALEYFSGSGDVVYYPMSTASSGGNIVSVNGKTGAVHLKVVDVSNGNSPDENAYIFIDESDDYPEVISPDSSKLGGQLPSYYASAEEVSHLKNDKLDKTATAVDSDKLGGKAPEYYASAEEVSHLKNDKLDKTATAVDSDKLGGKAPEYYASAEEVSHLKNDIGDAWTSGKTYAVGDYCINGNLLYKCKTAHTAGSAFDASYWDAVSVSNEISKVSSQIPKIIGSYRSNSLDNEFILNVETGHLYMVTALHSGGPYYYLYYVNLLSSSPKVMPIAVTYGENHVSLDRGTLTLTIKPVTQYCDISAIRLI